MKKFPTVFKKTSNGSLTVLMNICSNSTVRTCKCGDSKSIVSGNASEYGKYQQRRILRIRVEQILASFNTKLD
jgi:hypothetical protein